MTVRLTTLCENTACIMGFTGEWGLCIMVEAEGETVLLDSGLNDSVTRNAMLGGINLNKISKIVLSHGHADHTGGLRGLLMMLRKKVEIFAHPDIWGNKYTMFKLPGAREGRYRYIGMPFRREELQGLGAVFVLNREPVWLNEHMVTTGEVPMITPFEKIDDNMYVREGETFVPDAIADDQGLVVKTEKGLIVILGCAHRGMVNTLLQAQKITGIEKIYAVVGGTHLIRAGAEQLGESINWLRKLGVEKIGVSHCTGLAASSILAREFEGRFFFNNAGSVVEL